MKKTILHFSFLLLIVTCLCGCDINKEIKQISKSKINSNISCSISNQYKDEYGYSYYIEGTCTNNSSTDYDYLQVEFICYDAAGNNLGTAFDNTNNLLGGQTWKYKAMDLITDSNNIDHCDYHEVTGW